MLVGDLGIWPDIAEIGDREGGSRGKKIEYGGREGNSEYLNNLKEVENLESLD